MHSSSEFIRDECKAPQESMNQEKQAKPRASTGSQHRGRTKVQAMSRRQGARKRQIKGAKVSSHGSSTSTHSQQEAGPSNKWTKTPDSGLELDNSATVATDTVMDGAGEMESVFRLHPTLMGKDDSAQTRYIKTSGNATIDHFPSIWR